MSPAEPLRLGPVKEASATLAGAFANDPVNCWIRPLTSVAEKTGPGARRVYSRWIQSHNLAGVVLESQPPYTKSHLLGGAEGDDSPAAVILLTAPESEQRWTIRALWSALKLLFINVLWDPIDLQLPESRLKEFQRCQKVGIHRLLKENPEAWHLEMIGVHPSLQGKGMGKLAMKAVFDYVDQAPILIECSSEKNLPFYKSLGFTILEEVEMVDAPQFEGDTGRVKQWLMIRALGATDEGKMNPKKG
ncbi:hypothetical protein N7462_007981 [Penicillium macrosclerotiorum]|uniref:uncharacterized protein n=1 Tax=Penicillium macrosclerotiorum TaxID=303699 RepID=UPI002546B60E|nr:uncharacterized protein N7462_007981 [Penicillium macrosclerotiorum]KAJ5679737.1 hypothetical protein N7462_007981 [Penicillium macrosclerotiorum]